MRQVHRTASIIAGIYTLVQAIIYTVFAIYGCAIFTCLAKYPLTVDENHKVNYLLYLAYFKGKCDTETPVEADSADRTYYFLIAYGIASAVWIPTSTLLVVASVSRVKGSSGAWLYYPWICNSVLLLIMDIVGGVWYGIDISKTLSVTAFVKFIGQNLGPSPNNYDRGWDGITVVPSVIMTAIFLRGAVLLILNTIFLGVVIQACRDVKKSFSTSEFIRGSAPKNIQRQMEKNKELHKDEDPEVRWVRVTEEVMLPRLEVPPPPPPERIEQVPTTERIDLDRNESRQVEREYPISPQSPISDGPSPVIKRRPSLHRIGSSPVFDVRGNLTGETFPFPQDPNRRYIVDPPNRFQYVERDYEEREREMNRERQIERETDRELARLRELERERQDREFQRLKGAAEEDKLSNQRPWSYVNPSDLKLTPKYDQTMRPRFAPPEVPPKPSIPAPDYTTSQFGVASRDPTRWDPTNLSRSNSGAGDRYNDQRGNPRRARNYFY